MDQDQRQRGWQGWRSPPRAAASAIVGHFPIGLSFDRGDLLVSWLCLCSLFAYLAMYVKKIENQHECHCTWGWNLRHFDTRCDTVSNTPYYVSIAFTGDPDNSTQKRAKDYRSSDPNTERMIENLTIYRGNRDSTALQEKEKKKPRKRTNRQKTFKTKIDAKSKCQTVAGFVQDWPVVEKNQERVTIMVVRRREDQHNWSIRCRLSSFDWSRTFLVSGASCL